MLFAWVGVVWTLAAASLDESAVRADLDRGSTYVVLPLHSQQAASATVRLRWVDPGDDGEFTEQIVSLKPGINPVRIPLPLPEDTVVASLRLHYAVKASGESIEGYLALNQIAAHAFTGWVTLPRSVRSAGRLSIPVFFVHPVTGHPAAGVEIEGGVEIAERTQAVERARSNERGLANLEVTLPEPESAQSVSVKLKACRGDYCLELDENAELSDRSRIDIVTDKPLYQPGQTVHLRALLFNRMALAVAGTAVTFEVRDEEDTLLFRQRSDTSRFGVAFADWPIPGNSRLGSFTIRASAHGLTVTNLQVRVSRYQLPNFSVGVKPDRTYYLQGQKVVVAVSAAYLFGKPVQGGKVRVVREAGRRWNYREQRWQNDESTLIHATADSKGTAVITIPADASPERYEDRSFAAYVTDPSNGRTEQKRFTIRFSRDPIHIYWLTSGTGWYVTSSYADGAPASCVVAGRDTEGRELFRVRTNRLGVARVPGFETAAKEFRLFAQDDSGHTGSLTENYWPLDRPKGQPRTERTIHLPGQPIRVEIESGEPEGTVLLQTSIAGQPIATATVPVRGGRATTEFPYDERYRGEVELRAFLGRAGAAWDTGRKLLFPSKTGLRVEVALSRKEYKPGDDAAADFRVLSPEGLPLEAALGVVITDKGVEERAGSPAFRTWERELHGVTLRQLLDLDLTQPVPEDLDLLAEVLLANDPLGPWQISGMGNETPRTEFASLFKRQFAGIGKRLAKFDRSQEPLPRDEPVLAETLAGRPWTELRDPWGRPYRVRFFNRGTHEYIEFVSDGEDKRPDSGDDFSVYEYQRPYFERFNRRIKAALLEFSDVPGRAAFDQVLVKAGIKPEEFRDPWGEPYEVGITVSGPFRTVHVLTRSGMRNNPQPVAYFEKLYFDDTARGMWNALGGQSLPKSERQLLKLLASNGFDLAPLRDPWGNPYRVEVSDTKRYGDRVDYITTRRYGEAARQQRRIEPATQVVRTVKIYTNGADGRPFTPDDAVVANLPRLISTQVARDRGPVKVRSGKGSGMIGGVVRDASGAIIARAEITVRRDDVKESLLYETTSREDGAFQLNGLPDGVYTIVVRMAGFRLFTYSDIPVRKGKPVWLDVALEVGAVTEAVEVAAAPMTLQTESSSVSVSQVAVTSTPRVREDFPETLLWQPSVETDREGRARVNFRMADSITAWKLSVVGSTMDGGIALAETEFKSFQPFFADLDPPPVLTQGDRLDLPAVIRNYLDRRQSVEAALESGEALELPPGGARKTVEVAPDGSASVAFPVRASKADEAKPKLTATSADGGDVIRKTITVHPDGKRSEITDAAVYRGSAELRLTIPKNVIPGSTRGQVKLYPNLFAHVFDAIEGIRRRPYGCAEQTISSTYPNLLVLRMLAAAGAEDDMAREARRYTVMGYQSLLGYQGADGGFDYWRHGRGDVALTAYAVQFLVDAKEHIAVDEEVISTAVKWLGRNQRSNGSWSDGNVAVTAYVLHALAGAGPAAQLLVTRAWEFLSRSDLVESAPYPAAAIALARGDAPSLDRLRRLARREGTLVYWNLETNSPFYGWGMAGRVETTALALQAFLRIAPADPLVQPAMEFLLRRKDSSGVWFSGRATVDVLRALALVVESTSVGEGGESLVTVNGKPAGKFDVPAGVTAPLLTLNVTALLEPGENVIRVEGASARAASLHATAEYHVPWGVPIVDSATFATSRLRLRVSFDRHNIRLGESITASVRAVRIGFRGYGMMLGEIGLPPGVDVDRESLDSAGVPYEIQPDRVVVYLWPAAGGQDLQVRFRPRFRMQAKSSSSRLYDYYNPDLLVENTPVSFTVR